MKLVRDPLYSLKIVNQVVVSNSFWVSSSTNVFLSCKQQLIEPLVELLLEMLLSEAQLRDKWKTVKEVGELVRCW